ncbi:MAG: UDP-glucose/GDP-mannose dehydrogenase family protein, partial [Bdellovibrionales bacterium]|nr:UDP-glucose/GDP-mannose dehydrogenase family protein [Bdellovibrionales bacterium]
MNISVVGTGYVGLVAGVCFADTGHHVICVDNNPEKIKKLNEGIIPIYEPGLEDILEPARRSERIQFTTDLKMAVEKTDVVFIAVGTPESADGRADMGPTFAVVKAIADAANGPKTVVLKSTVPVGTAKDVQSKFDSMCKHPIEVVNNPEFLKEGAAIDDFLRPDRVVVGCRGEKAEKVMRELYAPFVKNGHPIYIMDNTSAELTKYAANAFLSVKISFINELARLADKVGADITSVRQGFTSDSRINPAFFYPGVGYGGSCFPKDVMALIQTGKDYDVEMKIVKSADVVNDEQKMLIVQKVKSRFGD